MNRKAPRRTNRPDPEVFLSSSGSKGDTRSHKSLRGLRGETGGKKQRGGGDSGYDSLWEEGQTHGNWGKSPLSSHKSEWGAFTYPPAFLSTTPKASDFRVPAFSGVVPRKGGEFLKEATPGPGHYSPAPAVTPTGPNLSRHTGRKAPAEVSLLGPGQYVVREEKQKCFNTFDSSMAFNSRGQRFARPPPEGPGPGAFSPSSPTFRIFKTRTLPDAPLPPRPDWEAALAQKSAILRQFVSVFEPKRPEFNPRLLPKLGAEPLNPSTLHIGEERETKTLPFHPPRPSLREISKALSRETQFPTPPQRLERQAEAILRRLLSLPGQREKKSPEASKKPDRSFLLSKSRMLTNL